MFTIGKLAQHAHVNVETIRYYQRIGLMRIPEAINHYRYYQDQDIETLSFIQKSKDAGLQLNEIKELLQLQLNDRQSVQHVIEQRLAKIDRRIQELQGLRERLDVWLNECKSSHSESCPILLNLKCHTDKTDQH